MSQPISLFNTYASDVMGTQTNGVSVSSTNTYYSLPVSGSRAAFMALHLVWSGTPTGTFTIWASDLPAPTTEDDTDWVQDTTFSPTNPAGSAGKMRDNIGNSAARRWRVKYVNSSGTGTLTGYATVARFGG